MRPTPLLLAASLLVATACARSASPGATSAPPVAPAAAADTPCFPGAPPLVATEIYERFQAHADAAFGGDAEPPVPTEQFGSCTVEGAQIRDAGGLVAELGCGLRVLRPGIVDDLGLQLGARGQDVLDRKPRPVPELGCVANGPDQARCWFDRPDGDDTDATSYVVTGGLGDQALRGAAAVAFFAPRPLAEIDVSIWCH